MLVVAAISCSSSFSRSASLLSPLPTARGRASRAQWHQDRSLCPSVCSELHVLATLLQPVLEGMVGAAGEQQKALESVLPCQNPGSGGVPGLAFSLFTPSLSSVLQETPSWLREWLKGVWSEKELLVLAPLLRTPGQRQCLPEGPRRISD